MSMPRIMVVDDEILIAQNIKNELIGEGYIVPAVATTALAALKLAERDPPDLVLLDIRLGEGMDGLEAARHLWTGMGVPVLLMSGHHPTDLETQAQLAGSVGCLAKPFLPEHLRAAVATALSRAEFEKKIRAQERRYRDLFENAPCAYLVVDVNNGSITDCNSGAIKLLGWDRGTLLGLRARTLIPDTRPDRDLALKVVSRLRRGELVQDIELQVKRENGTLVWVSLSGTAILDMGNQLKEYRFTLTDITSRKNMETALREVNSQLDLLAFIIQSTEDAVIARNLAGEIISWNPAAARIYGYSADEVMGRVFTDHVPEDRQAESTTILAAQVMAGEAIRQLETVRLKKDGTPINVSLTMSPILDRAGQITGVSTIARDITRRRAAEKALRESESRFRLLAENSADVIWTRNANLEITYLSPSVFRMTGFSPSEANSLGMGVILTPESQAVVDRHLNEILSTDAAGRPDRTARRLVLEGWRKDGSKIWMEVMASPQFDEYGHFTGVVGVSRDCTAQKQLSEELTKAKEGAEAANQAKSEFLANMSHEIRTPLNGLLGMLELLTDTQLDSEQHQYAKLASSAAQSLLTLINDILDFSKIEAGRLELENLPFNLWDGLDDTLRTMALTAHEKGLELSCRIRPDLPEILNGDPGRLRQIIVNLVGNAIKFTSNGEVALEAGLESRTEETLTIHFTVRDTGIGIPAERHEMIFDSFTQADGSTSRKYGGTGLGLAITTSLVRMMNGRMWLESLPGQGSVFHFTARFGVESSTNHRPRLVDTGTLAGRRVLIVDDHPTNRLILTEMLQTWHMRPESAAGGQEALAMIRNATIRSQPFDLLLIDAQMPGMDGWALAEQIRQTKGHDRLIMIMITSTGQRGDAARSRALGFIGYLLKPISRTELLAAVRLAFGQSAPEDQPSGFITRHSLREVHGQTKILVVEDEPVSRQLVAKILEKQGYGITMAIDGLTALEALKRDTFDLVLMDVTMPEMDGFETTTIIRQREQRTGKRVPIVAMTAHAMSGDREKCLAAGMDDYLAKPISGPILCQLLDRYLSPGDH